MIINFIWKEFDLLFVGLDPGAVIVVGAGAGPGADQGAETGQL